MVQAGSGMLIPEVITGVIIIIPGIIIIAPAGGDRPFTVRRTACHILITTARNGRLFAIRITATCAYIPTELHIQPLAAATMYMLLKDAGLLLFVHLRQQ